MSSANYEARRFGVRAGMFTGQATQLCPALVTLPYDFEAYERVAAQVRGAACWRRAVKALLRCVTSAVMMWHVCSRTDAWHRVHSRACVMP